MVETIAAILIIAALIGTFSVFADGLERFDERLCIMYQSDTMLQLRTTDERWKCNEVVDNYLTNNSGFKFLDYEYSLSLGEYSAVWILTK